MDTRNRAILIILVVILFMSGIFAAISVYEYKQSYSEKIHHHEKTLEYLVEAEFSRMTKTYVSRLNGFVRSNKGIINAFKNKDRESLLELLTPRFNTFTKENKDFYNISFYLPDGKLYLSMADVSSYGVDMSAHSFLRSLSEKTDALHGFTISNDKLFFQAAKNIIIDGQRIGVIEFLVHTHAMNELIKEILNAEYGLSLSNSGTINNGILSHATIIDKSCSIYDKLPISFDFNNKIQTFDIGNSRYLIHSKEIYDYKGDLIGHYLTSNNITDTKNKFATFFLYILIVTAVMIILSTSVLYIGFGAVLKKVENLNISLETKVAERTRELEEAKDNAIYQNRVISSLYKRFKSMFQDHHSIMFLISPIDGSIIDANHAASKFFHMKKEELVKLRVSDVSLLPEEDVLEMINKSMTEGLQNYISKFKMGQSVFDIEVQASPIEMDGQSMLFAICHDVTEKVIMENELKELNKNLERMVTEEAEKRRQQELLLIQQSKMSSVGEILSAIIHQWKQPLTAISYLMQDVADSAERNVLEQEYLINLSTEALNQINYMNQTVEDFRKFLMPSKSKEVFNVALDVRRAVKMLSKQLEKDDIDLHLTVVNTNTDIATYETADELLESETYKINISCFDSYGYANEFKQVLMNIINNARDAILTINKETKLDGKINIVLSCHGESIEISVSDNAGGIPEEIADRIFEPYFTTKSSKGTGIGLYMAKNIIEKHMEGTITATNCDRGALFTIVLKTNENSV